MASLEQPRFLNPCRHEEQNIELIIGIDVGMTFSGVCYTFLRPGEIPQVRSVTRFTNQTSGDGKIPSIMYYDEDSMLRAAGATATLLNTVHEAQFEGWFKAQHFKMHLRPSDMKIDSHGLELGALPPLKTAAEVMGDFLRYLFLETLMYIEKHHVDGEELLDEVSRRTKFVLSLPNGWKGLSRQRMREAAIMGGLVKDGEDSLARVNFVSEGEASALSCLAGRFSPSDLRPGFRFMIADLGGGTLDMTTYEVINASPLQLKEVTLPDCCFAGSVFVNVKATELLHNELRGSQYDNPEIIDDAIDSYFEPYTKRQFKNAEKRSYLRIGEPMDNDDELHIQGGYLRLDGMELASCFEYSISEALRTIRAQIVASGGRAMPVWLVGGFSASPWLCNKLTSDLRRDGIDVKRPDDDLWNSAVAHGNILYRLLHPVISRTVESTYGIECNTPFQQRDPDHRRRAHLKFTDVSGQEMMPGRFNVIVKKNAEVKETQYYTTKCNRHIQGLGEATFECVLLRYDHADAPPCWCDGNKEKFRIACRIKADLSALCLPSKLRTCKGHNFWTVRYEIELAFGSTELQARIKWVENGKTKCGPASIIYEE